MDGTERPRLRDHSGVVCNLLALSLLAAAYEIVPASVTPVIATNLGVGPAAVSWLVSVMLGVAVVASVPTGILIDRVTVQYAIGFSSLLFVLAGIGSWWAATRGAYSALVAMRLLAGVGFVVVWNAGIDVFGTFRNPATAASLFTASGPVGFAVAHVTGPRLAAAFGWPSVFLAYPLLLVLPTAYLIVVGGSPLTRVSVDVPQVGEYGRLLRNRTVVLLCALGFLSYSLYLFINSWMPTYLNAELGVTIAQSGLLVALFPLMGAAARLSGGLVTDRLLGGRRRPVVLASFVVAVPLLAASYAETNVLALTALLAALGFFVQLSLGLFYSYVPAVLPPAFATSGVALLTSVSLGGAFSAPIIAGALIQRSGAYLTAFGYAVGMAVLGTVLALLLVEASR